MLRSALPLLCMLPLLFAGCSLVIEVDGCEDDTDCLNGTACVQGYCASEEGADAQPADATPGEDADALERRDRGMASGDVGITRRDAQIQRPDAAPGSDGGAADAGPPRADAAPGCLDQDGDGFGQGCLAGLDCDDQNRMRNPGVAETCNEVDDDCDDRIDEATDRTCYPFDQGQPGVGLCQSGLQVCVDGAYGDCVGATGPGESGRPCDAQDNDCDGQVDEADEGCVCEPDDLQACYGGPPGTVGQGPCREGVQRCEGGVFGACRDQVKPRNETCDGRDEDCDGEVDEAVQNACGVCGPVPDETCNGLDDDCDGRTDEALAGLGRPCIAGLGICRREGEGVCNPGNGQVVCDAEPGNARAEICNGDDDDCDGSTDEGVVPPRCERRDGICAGLRTRCENGVIRACTLADYRAHNGAFVDRETRNHCDGLDNDCDGRTDEACDCQDGQTTPCGTDVGACRAGMQLCDNGRFGACMGERGPDMETCNGVDDDCDGRTDEGLVNVCGTDVGACRRGQAICEGGSFGLCMGAIGPEAETCNDIDDDCDGETDERLERACGSDVGACEAGIQTCRNGDWGTCQGEGEPEAEQCNEGDDDCDGRTDEDFNLNTSLIHCGDCNRRCRLLGADACIGGVCKCGNSIQCRPGEICEAGRCLDFNDPRNHR